MPDVSELYPKAPAAGGNALTLDPARMIGLIAPLNQAALFQQQFAGRKAIGEAYQHAIRPDGSIDTTSLMQEIKRRPDAGFLAGEASEGALRRVQQQIQNAQAGQNLKIQQNAFIADGLGTLANLDNPTMNDVHDFAVRAARNIGVPPAMINAWTHGLPQEGKPLKDALTKMSLMARGAATTATPENIVTPSGTTQQMTAGQSARERQLGGAAAPGAAPGGPPGIAGPAPGTVAAGEVAGTESGKLYSSTRDQAANYRRQVYPLEKAIPALEKLGTTGTGPGTETINDLWSFAQSMGMPLGERTGTIKDYDTARKYLTDWVMQNGNTGTNDKLVASFASNPNTHISNAAATDLAKAALSLRRMQHSLFREFQETGKPKDEFADWAAKRNPKMDPRVFGFDMMTPAQRNDVLKSVNRKAFLNEVRQAEKFDILSPQGLGK